MPPKAKITKEMVITAAFEIARTEGAEQINARNIAKKLNCSTQPVLYCFKTIEEIKKSTYKKADEYHTECLMQISGENPMIDIGLNYIRFAAEEKQLFRFLMQSDGFSGKNLSQIMESDELSPIIGIFAEAMGVNKGQAGKIFKTLFLYVHGYAGMLANNSMEYDEAAVTEELVQLFNAITAERT